MLNIRLEHLRRSDLNLLVHFAVLAEEKNISRAARRLELTQPSMTRALQRLRRVFRDDLLVRGPTGYALTPQGQLLQQELANLLPRLDRLYTGPEFDPGRKTARFRICANDNSAHLFSGPLCRQLARWERVTFDLQPWSDQVYADLDHGRTDLIFAAQDGLLPRHLREEVLFEDEVVCVVSKDHPLEGPVTLEQYTAGRHIDVTVLRNTQSFLERELAKRGYTRRNVFHVPYFSAAIRAVAGTDLKTTVPRRLANLIHDRATTRLLPLPPDIARYRYGMAWHPRLEADAQHRWLRQTLREAVPQVPPLE